MATLHLMTGGKGGVGKTLCALAATLHHLERNERVVLIDLNYHNHDLAELLYPLADSRKQTPLRDSGFSVVPIRRSLDPRSLDCVAYAVFPDPSGRIFGKLPWEGGLGVLRQLNSILEALEDGYGVEDGYRPDSYIVDTGLHLANINPATPDQFKPAQDIIQKEMSALVSARLYLWFVWTFATLDRHSETEASKRSMAVLKKVHRDGKAWFDDRKQLVHVINPHAISLPLTFRELILPKDPYCIKALLSLSHGRVVDNLSFEAFYLTARRVLLESAVREDTDIYFERLARAIGFQDDQSGNISRRRRDWVRPGNVFSIPYYSKKITAYTDLLRTAYNDERYGTRFIMKHLGEVYSSISSYMGGGAFR